MSLIDVSDSMFVQPAHVMVTAATVGVHRSRWHSLSSSEVSNKQHAADEMREHRFDVLPIDDGVPRPVKAFFRTTSWGRWDNVEQVPIQHSDILPCSTPVFDLLRELVSEKRYFYFLDFHDEVVGLVSTVNFNSRDAKIAINALLVTLEDLLSEFIHLQGYTDDCLREFLGSSARRQFEAERMANQDHEPLQNFYLKDLFAIVRTKKLYNQLRYENAELFETPGAGNCRRANELVQLRNRSMHSVRSLITAEYTPQRLWKVIERAQDMCFRLRQSLLHPEAEKSTTKCQIT